MPTRRLRSPFLTIFGRSAEWLGERTRFLASYPLTKNKKRTPMKIQQIMSTPAITCRSTDTLNTAAQLMWDHDCGALPVVGDDGALVGMITDRDICMALYTQGKPMQAIPVSTAMATQVFSCRETDPLEAAEHMMNANQIRRIPIVDADNRPIGLVGLSDLARTAVSSPRKSGLEQEVSRTLAAICQPREAPARRRAEPAIEEYKHQFATA